MGRDRNARVRRAGVCFPGRDGPRAADFAIAESQDVIESKAPALAAGSIEIQNLAAVNDAPCAIREE